MESFAQLTTIRHIIYNVKGKKKERDWKRDMFIYIKIVNDFL